MEEVVSITTNADGSFTYNTEADLKTGPTLAELFPNVNYFLHRPLIANPPMCTLKELQDYTYSIDDLFLMHELIDLKEHIS